MNRRTASLLSASLVCSTLSTTAVAEPSNVDPAHQYSWGENIGWVNWFSAGPVPGQQGVVIGGFFMSGFAWAENVGWINFGDGAPENGLAYTNLSGTDFGVNIDPDGRLRGYAWGENIGWISFDTFPTLSANGTWARLDAGARRLKGYAWSENVGWINLDDPGAYVSIGCRADYNTDGFITFEDFDAFVVSFEAGEAASDFGGDGFLTFEDFDAFVAAFEAGC